MKEPLPDEFLSAYLDGELTPEERARVERALAENAEQRRLLEELEAVRGKLQGMPVHQPPAALADRILRRAEEMVRDRNGAGRVGPSAVHASAASAERNGRGNAGGGGGFSLPWRRLAVAGAAIAASLLLVVLALNTNPRELAVQQTAIRSPSGPAERGDFAESRRLAEESREEAGVNFRQGAMEMPGEMAEANGAFAPASGDSAPGRAPADNRYSIDELPTKGGYSRHDARPDLDRAGKKEGSRGLAVLGRQAGEPAESQVPKKQARDAESLERQDATSAPLQMEESPRQRALAEAAPRGGRGEEARLGGMPLPGAQAASPGEAATAGSSLGLQYLAENGTRIQQADALFRQIIPGDIYVVPLDVEPVALQPANVNRVFLRNSIDVASLSDDDPATALDTLNRSAGGPRAAPAPAPTESGRKEAANADSPEAAEPEELVEKEAVRGRAQEAVETIEQQLAGPAQANLYYVEASSEQLQGLLRDFAQRPGLVRSFNNAAPLKNYHQLRFRRGFADGVTPYFGGTEPPQAANDFATPRAGGLGGGGTAQPSPGAPPPLASGKDDNSEPSSGSRPNVPAESSPAADPLPSDRRQTATRPSLARGQALQIPSDSLQARARKRVLSSVAAREEAADKSAAEGIARSDSSPYRVLLILQADPQPPAAPFGDQQRAPREHATEESHGGSQDPPSRRRPPGR